MCIEAQRKHFLKLTFTSNQGFNKTCNIYGTNPKWFHEKLPNMYHCKYLWALGSVYVSVR